MTEPKTLLEVLDRHCPPPIDCPDCGRRIGWGIAGVVRDRVLTKHRGNAECLARATADALIVNYMALAGEWHSVCRSVAEQHPTGVRGDRRYERWWAPVWAVAIAELPWPAHLRRSLITFIGVDSDRRAAALAAFLAGEITAYVEVMQDLRKESANAT